MEKDQGQIHEEMDCGPNHDQPAQGGKRRMGLFQTYSPTEQPEEHLEGAEGKANGKAWNAAVVKKLSSIAFFAPRSCSAIAYASLCLALCWGLSYLISCL